MKLFNIIACGGCGINIVNKALTEDLLEHCNAYAVDTSNSNPTLEKGYAKTFRYTTKEEGSGGMRAENAEIIAAETPSIISEIDRARVTLIVASTSGGTGSLAQYYLAKSIVKSGGSCILMLIGDGGKNERYVLNNASTIKSLYSLCGEIESSITYIYENNVALGKENVNQVMTTVLSVCDQLFGKENFGLDNKDIKVFLNPSEAANVDFQPARLFVLDSTDDDFDDKIKAIDAIGAITGVTISPDTNTDPSLPYNIIHHKGTVSSELMDREIHLITTFDSDITENFINSQTKVKDIQQARQQKLASRLNNVSKSISGGGPEL
jgi:hypothetical protein